MRNIHDLPAVTIEQVLKWAENHKAATGSWPRFKSGPILDTEETWAGINAALKRGSRGLPAVGSLAEFLAVYCDVRNRGNLPSLTVDQVLAWADEHKAAKGNWPNRNSGQIIGTDEIWERINDALMVGTRGLPAGQSVARLLAEHRDARNPKALSPLSVKKILTWADAHKDATGTWPGKESGRVHGTDETWAGINSALIRGSRALDQGSLADLLAKHSRVRNRKRLPPLSVEQILKWADAFKKSTGGWPNKNNGAVTGTNETWGGINVALERGGRGIPGGSSLPKLFGEHRDVRNRADLPLLTVKQILVWADAHKAVTGCWPTTKSGKIDGTDETWSGVGSALQRGTRGLRSRSSLVKVLVKHRNARSQRILPPLTISQILAWMDAHKRSAGKWPTPKSGQVTGTDETWAGIGHALRIGYRGLPGASSLADLLSEHRGVRNIRNLPPLSVEQILKWADAHKKSTGGWPNKNNGAVSGTNETWGGINVALDRGGRGLSGGSSLVKLLQHHRMPMK